MEAQTIKPNEGKELGIKVGDETYLRLPIKTRLIIEKDNLLDLLQVYVAPLLLPDDLIFISEKVVALVQGRIMRIRDVKPSRLARFLARKVDNKWNTKDFRGFGHGTPMAMQLLIQEAGYPRVIFAAGVAAITRPLGIKGLFYLISGKKAKSIDCPMSFLLYPYTQYAKLPPLEPMRVAQQIRKQFGHEVAIVDANYRGVFSLARTSKKITEKFVRDVFRDNPLGQSDELTPFCIIRKK